MQNKPTPLPNRITLETLSRDPYPLFQEMLAHAPVCWTPAFHLWMITRREEVIAILRDPETFTMEPVSARANPMEDIFGPMMLSLHVVKHSLSPSHCASTACERSSDTPYSSDLYHERGYYFAQQGYNFLLIDVRGRGGSGGEFDVMVNEKVDGPDAIEWVAAQPWCDGQVAMWGGSYAGLNQWLALREQTRGHPSHLRTIVPAAASEIAIDDTDRGPVHSGMRQYWLILTSNVAAAWNLFGQRQIWDVKLYRHHLSGAAWRTLGDFFGNIPNRYRQQMAKAPHDPSWHDLSLTPTDYARIDRPILTIASQYDVAQRGSLGNYRLHKRYGNAEAFAQHYLVLGPWDHAGTRTPRRHVGGWSFGAASEIDMNDLLRQWYDFCMKGAPLPPFLQMRVAYYVTGAEEWRYTDDIETVATEQLTFYLASDGNANDLFHSGQLTPVPVSGAPSDQSSDHYSYDPADTRFAELEFALLHSPTQARDAGGDNSLTDQLKAHNLFGNGLIYHSDPLPADVEVVGWPQLTLWLALDVPDTDFQVTLGEVLPDGRYLLLSETCARARYREGMDAEKLVEIGAILPYTFEGLTFFARHISQGSRLRLLITAPNSIFRQRNFNGGGDVDAESLADARVATVTLYHNQWC